MLASDRGLWLGSNEGQGFVFGMLGILAFSFTLPFSRVASPQLGGLFVGIERALLASALAIVILLWRREAWPERRHWWPICIVALGTVLGFGPLSSLAMQYLPAAHGVVVIGLLPAATAVMAVLRAGEHPPRSFWLACSLGVAAVVVFAIVQGAGHPQWGDLLLLGAVVMASLGYAEGARLTRELGGWRVISWALVFSLPVIVMLSVVLYVWNGWPSGDAEAWWSMLYLGAVSMFFGFFPWYRGLAVGGVAKVGQLQLVQPVLSLIWAALLLGEHLSVGTILASLLVIASAALSRLARR
ncbi:MAG TPA: DMT family transporter [Thermomicrobiales bacterium]|nr:DMT family transporter [Thermomicrobiales bacterium]